MKCDGLLANTAKRNITEIGHGLLYASRAEKVTPAQWGRQVGQAEAAFQAGDVRRAIDIYEEGIACGVCDVGAFQSLGDLYLFMRDYGRALGWFEWVWSIDTSMQTLDRIVMALVGMGQVEQAYGRVTRALAERSVSGLQENQMAESLYLVWPGWKGDLDAGVQDPELLVKAGMRIADWLFKAQQTDLAQAAYERILTLKPTALAHARLGHLYRFSGDFSHAQRHLQAAVELEPDNATYRGLLGNMLLLTGEIEQGMDQLRTAVSHDSSNAELHSSYLFSSHYCPDQNRMALLEDRKGWGRLHAPRSLTFKPPKRDMDPERRLRIGYLGADFRRHSVGYTFAGVLTGRNRQAVKVYGYGSVAQPDDMTEQFRRLFDVYRDVYALDDVTLARLIAADEIDILVAVAGHSFGHRLKVLAYKPAPIQVDYGSINTLGMEQVDYRITDPQLNPPASQAYFLEKLVYLPTGYVCYCPPAKSPALGPLPAWTNGFVTFGCFNGAQKVNRHIVDLWGLILRELPQARLLIKCPGGDDAALHRHFAQQLEQAGVERERVTVQGLLPQNRHLELYHQIDIALDTYPFNGCVTTLEGLWMGVPVITLVGQTTVSRVGLTLLTQLGLNTLVAHSPDQYVHKAVALASQVKPLARIRASLRQRMLTSTLCDPTCHAEALESAYRHMWQDYCRSQPHHQNASKSEVHA